MRLRVDQGSSNHVAGQARIVFSQFSLSGSLGQQVSNMMHKNTGALECRGAGLDRRILDDQVHRPAVFFELRFHFIGHGLYIDHILQDSSL